MFNNCPIIYLSEFDTNNIINMSYMFKNCSELKNLKCISKFNPEKVLYMTGMFQNCFYLETLEDINN